MTNTENPPAFPSVCLNDPGHPASVPGMGLRDWFAGQALAGLAGSMSEIERTEIAEGVRGGRFFVGAAYALADAMLAARTSKENPA